jgi:hypothetical protein
LKAERKAQVRDHTSRARLGTGNSLANFGISMDMTGVPFPKPSKADDESTATHECPRPSLNTAHECSGLFRFPSLSSCRTRRRRLTLGQKGKPREELAFYCIRRWIERLCCLCHRHDRCRNRRFYRKAMLLDSSRLVWIFVPEPQFPAGSSGRTSLVVVNRTPHPLAGFGCFSDIRPLEF